MVFNLHLGQPGGGNGGLPLQFGRHGVDGVLELLGIDCFSLPLGDDQRGRQRD